MTAPFVVEASGIEASRMVEALETGLVALTDDDLRDCVEVGDGRDGRSRPSKRRRTGL